VKTHGPYQAETTMMITEVDLVGLVVPKEEDADNKKNVIV
jgi:hypothetical protein